ncbi:unnamed protein product [Symbiodinium microadriaticum]|nr:unnamed protein product [Symbiodinium sp. KB8]CAE7879477.1 unnamed protein product [Symbiodinium microadriaticum]
MAWELSKLATLPLARPCTLSRRNGESLPLTHRGAKLSRDNALPAIVFQVFWFPRLPGESVFRKRIDDPKAFFMGEVLVPPLCNLGEEYRLHRLPVQRSNRVPPDGIMSYDQWQLQFGRHYLNKYQQPRQKFKERAERLLKAQERETQAEGDMAEVAEAFSAAFPLCGSGIFESPTGPDMQPEAQRPKHPKHKQPEPAPLTQLPDPISAEDPNRVGGREEEKAAVRLLSADFQAPCYLDVDLAFVGLSEMEKAFVSDYAGTFAFKVQTLRVPPMSDGWVRIQACEVCCDGDLVDVEERCELQEKPGNCPTPNGAALSGILAARASGGKMANSLPVYPLWCSSWEAGSLEFATREGIPCTLNFSGPPVSVWVSATESVRRQRHSLGPFTARDRVDRRDRRLTFHDDDYFPRNVPIRLIAVDPWHEPNERIRGRGEAVSYVAEAGGVLTADVCVLDDDAEKFCGTKLYCLKDGHHGVAS